MLAKNTSWMVDFYGLFTITIYELKITLRSHVIFSGVITIENLLEMLQNHYLA